MGGGGGLVAKFCIQYMMTAHVIYLARYCNSSADVLGPHGGPELTQVVKAWPQNRFQKLPAQAAGFDERNGKFLN